MLTFYNNYVLSWDEITFVWFSSAYIGLGNKLESHCIYVLFCIFSSICKYCSYWGKYLSAGMCIRECVCARVSVCIKCTQWDYPQLAASCISLCTAEGEHWAATEHSRCHPRPENGSQQETWEVLPIMNIPQTPSHSNYSDNEYHMCPVP